MCTFSPVMTRNLFVAALALGVAGRTAGAQDPVKLPGVVVKATPNPPGPRRMGGVVRDTFELYAPTDRTIELEPWRRWRLRSCCPRPARCRRS